MTFLTATGAVILCAVAGASLAVGGCGRSLPLSASSSAAPSPTSTVPNEAVIGMTVEQATAWAEEHGNTIRVVKQDGQPLPATMDYRPERINVEVENGMITAARMG